MICISGNQKADLGHLCGNQKYAEQICDKACCSALEDFLEAEVRKRCTLGT